MFIRDQMVDNALASERFCVQFFTIYLLFSHHKLGADFCLIRSLVKTSLSEIYGTLRT
jgi:hypothetical protein